jgi:hypothetical protein
MFQLRHVKFTYGDAGLDNMNYEQRPTRRQRDARRSQVFSDLITNGQEFDFGVDDIQRIRREFQSLIRNLHPLYQTVKDDKKRAEKEEKKARKQRRKEKTNEASQNATEKSSKAETSSATARTNLDNTNGGAANDSSDSSKENRFPMEDQEKLAQKVQRSNDEERRTSYDSLTAEASLQRLSLGTTAKENLPRQNSRNDDDSPDDREGDMRTNSDEIEQVQPTSCVNGEEMANNENIVHL